MRTLTAPVTIQFIYTCVKGPFLCSYMSRPSFMVVFMLQRERRTPHWPVHACPSVCRFFPVGEGILHDRGSLLRNSGTGAHGKRSHCWNTVRNSGLVSHQWKNDLKRNSDLRRHCLKFVAQILSHLCCIWPFECVLYTCRHSVIVCRRLRCCVQELLCSVATAVLNASVSTVL
jgi:hypothetical protein